MNFDETYKTKKFSQWNNLKKYVMLHHTGSTASSLNQVKYLAYNPTQVSCHYVVGRWWEVRKLWSDDRIMWHAGKWSYQWINDTMNYHAIGIEVCSDGYGYSNAQRKAVRELASYLINKYAIDVQDIIRHLDYTSRKWDIWDNFWNNEYKTFYEYQFSYLEEEIQNPEPISGIYSGTIYHSDWVTPLKINLEIG